MSLAELIPLVLKASIFGIVFSIGLRTSLGELSMGFRRPANLVKGAVAMFVLMPLVAVGLTLGLDPRAPTGLILVAAALSPVPPILPNKEMKAGAGAAQAVGGMVGASFLAMLLLPFGVSLIGSWFGLDLDIPREPAVRIVLTSILIPLFAGILLKTLVPGVADRLAGPAGKAAALLLLLAALPILFQIGPAMWGLLGGRTLLAFVLFAVIGVVVGHILGSENPDFQTVLAISTPSRHPALAAAVASAARPELEGILPAAVLYLLVSIVVTGVYLARRKKAGQPEAA